MEICSAQAGRWVQIPAGLLLPSPTTQAVKTIGEYLLSQSFLHRLLGCRRLWRWRFGWTRGVWGPDVVAQPWMNLREYYLG